LNPDTLVGIVPPILTGPLVALLVYGLGTAVGYRLLRIARVPLTSLDLWELGFVSATLGSATLQLIPACLAAAGIMTPLAVRAVFAILLVLAVPTMLRIGRAFVGEARRLSMHQLSASQRVWIALLGLVLVSLLVQASVFRGFGDDDGYHLSSPKRWLSTGGLDYLPTFTHTNASLGFEMLYVIALSITDVIGAKALHYGAGVFTLFGIFLASRRLDNSYAGLVAISIFLIPNQIFNVPLLFTVAYADFGATWMATASLLLFLVWREHRDFKILVCFALSAGFAGSFKFTCLGLALAWGLPVLYEARRGGLSWYRAIALVVCFGAIAIIPVIPWLIRNAILTGNPIYPILSSILPTRDWPAEHADIFGRYVRYYSWGIAQGKSLDEYSRRIILVIAGVMIAVGGIVCWRIIREPVLRAILVFSGSFTLLSIALTGMIFRYWLPAVLCGAIAVLVAATRRWSDKWRLWPASALLVVALVMSRTEPGHAVSSSVRIALGLSSYSEEYPNDKGWLMWSLINHQTPADARILAAAFYPSVGASSFGGFWSDRWFYVTDSHLQAYIRLTDWSSFIRSLREAKISHVLIFENQLNSDRLGFSFPAQENEYKFSRRLVDMYGKKLAQFDDLQLYQVSLDSAERSR
jgi:hypothetical protein